jgi:hypothetical protein
VLVSVSLVSDVDEPAGASDVPTDEVPAADWLAPRTDPDKSEHSCVPVTHTGSPASSFTHSSSVTVLPNVVLLAVSALKLPWSP